MEKKRDKMTFLGTQQLLIHTGCFKIEIDNGCFSRAVDYFEAVLKHTSLWMCSLSKHFQQIGRQTCWIVVGIVQKYVLFNMEEEEPNRYIYWEMLLCGSQI